MGKDKWTHKQTSLQNLLQNILLLVGGDDRDKLPRFKGLIQQLFSLRIPRA